MGKTQAEIGDMPNREIAEHFVMIAGVDKFDGRTPLQRQLDALAGLG